MSEQLEIPVSYRGQELTFKAELQKIGYVYKIAVDVYGVIVVYEQDDEGMYRGITEPSIEHKRIDIELIRAIGNVIEQSRK